MDFLTAQVVPHSRVRTVADLKRAVSAINAGTPNSGVAVIVFDPYGFGAKTMSLSDLRDTVVLKLTDVKRRWFVEVRKQDGKLEVIG